MSTSNPSSSAEPNDIRHAVYRHFIATGKAPAVEWLAAELGEAAAVVRAALDDLAAAHAIVLLPGSHDIWMAHPFSAVSTPYAVRAGGVTYQANCAWDALGIPVVLRTDSECDARCADCGEPLSLGVREERVVNRDAVVHFLVPPTRFWDDIGFT